MVYRRHAESQTSPGRATTRSSPSSPDSFQVGGTPLAATPVHDRLSVAIPLAGAVRVSSLADACPVTSRPAVPTTAVPTITQQVRRDSGSWSGTLFDLREPAGGHPGWPFLVPLRDGLSRSGPLLAENLVHGRGAADLVPITVSVAVPRPAALVMTAKSRRTCQRSSGAPSSRQKTRPWSCHCAPAWSRAAAGRLRCSFSAPIAFSAA
jgi:hypothetical protein